jgi:transketolase
MEMKSTREAVGLELVNLADDGVDIVSVAADTSKSMFTHLLRENYPEREYDIGIAEQNMMMIAAGLASTGKIAFASSYSVFTSMRCCEQIRTFIAYPNLNVKVIAGIGGLSAGIEGVTHVATEDLGVMRCIANMAVLAPSDFATTRKAVRSAAEYDGPVYIRVGRDPSPVLFDDTYDFRIGKPVLHREGADILFVSQGIVLSEVLKAADALAEEGVSAGVLEMHTLKPISDEDIIINEALKTRKVISVEEHNIVGGLASALSEILCGKGDIEFIKLGLRDTFAQTGTPAELVAVYGLDTSSLIAKAKELLV